MTRPDHSSLLVARQCGLLSISRSSYYHRPVGESAGNLALMTEINRQFLEMPFYGVRQMTWHLRAQGCLHAFSDGGEARGGIGGWIDFYNNRRPHSAHGGATPAGVYRDRLSA